LAVRESGNRISIYKNSVLIYNPSAGAFRRNPAFLEGTITLLRDDGHRVEAAPTTGPRTASRIAREAIDSGADLVLAAGGDGTINEVANGMVGSLVPLAILPGGTANVLATELGLGADMAAAARAVSGSIPRRIAVGRITAAGAAQRHFLLMAGAGIDAHIVYRLNLGLKARLGKLAYWIGGFCEFARRLDIFEARLDGRTISASFVLASRVRTYGSGFTIARTVSLLDNDFEIVVFAGEWPARYLMYLVGLLVGQVQRFRGVRVFRTRSVDLSCPSGSRVYVQVDGEYAGRLPSKVEIIDDALTLLLPSSFRH
jgi:YegS/Rv2252/BmrU family lipid kinase